MSNRDSFFGSLGRSTLGLIISVALNFGCLQVDNDSGLPTPVVQDTSVTATDYSGNVTLIPIQPTDIADSASSFQGPIVYVENLRALSEQAGPWVSFIHRNDAVNDLYIANPNSQALVRVASLPIPQSRINPPSPPQHEPVAWSPTGKYIAWIDMPNYPDGGPNTLYIIHQENGQVDEIANNLLGLRTPTLLNWSPSGDKLAYLGFNQNNIETLDIYIFDINTHTTTSLSALNPNWNRSEGPIVWAPNGEQIVVGNKNPQEGYEFVILSTVTGELLWQSSDNREVLGEYIGFPDVMWSPNGQHLLIENGCSYQYAVEKCDLYLLSMENEQLARVGQIMTPEEAGLVRLSYHSVWSPDSRYVVSQYVKPPALAGPDFDSLTETGMIIYDTKTGTRSTSAALPIVEYFLLERLIWHSDSLIWHSTQGWTSAQISGQQVQLTFDYSMLPIGCYPQSSPDSNYLAFVEGGDGGTCIPEDKNRGILVYSEISDELIHIGDNLGGPNWLVGWIP